MLLIVNILVTDSLFTQEGCSQNSKFLALIGAQEMPIFVIDPFVCSVKGFNRAFNLNLSNLGAF